VSRIGVTSVWGSPRFGPPTISFDQEQLRLDASAFSSSSCFMFSGPNWPNGISTRGASPKCPPA
jgi:hypothetical protein